jgi:non-specific protein-tyrosine kinase
MTSRLGPAEGPELRDYLRILRRRKWVIVACTLLVGLTVLGLSLVQEPVYRATAEVLLQPRTTESIFDPSVVQNLTSGRQAPTEIRVVQSDPVRAMVRADIGSSPAISVSNPEGSDFLLLSAESTSPERAAAMANAYGRAYVEYRRQLAVNDLEKAASDLEDGITDLDARIKQFDSGGGRTATPPSAFAPGESREQLVQQRAFYANRLDQIRLAVKQKTGGAQLQTPASVPTVPFKPTPQRDTGAALAIGLMLGLVAAYVWEYLDDSIVTKEDVERTVPGLPVLALVPAVAGWKNREFPAVITLREPSSPSAEGYRALRTSVQFLGVERPLHVIQVTSPSAAEGKSTTIANLAVVLANAGRRVTVVCCDLRRPRVHEFFKLSNAVGLTSVLIGEVSLGDAIVRVPDVPGLYLLPSGQLPPNPSELLGGQHVISVLQQLRPTGIVLVDSPPVLPVTDSVVLSSRVDATIIVATAGTTGQKELRRSREVLEQVQANVLGIVLNGVSPDAAYGDGYRYAGSTKGDTEVRVGGASVN